MEKNKKKNLLLKQCVICSILLVLICSLVVLDLSDRKTRDITPPSISFSATIVYEPDADITKLLKGVEAMDEESGDVTSSLRVRTVNISDDSKSAVVTYVAKDQSNNIGLKKRIVKVKKTEQELDVPSETEETP